MYVTTPFSRVVALDPENGAELWAFDPRLDLSESANLFINRGVAYWSDGKYKRIFLGTLDGRLFSLIPETGEPDTRFGVGGWVDLRKGVADEYPDKRIGMTSPPVVYRNLVICGSLVPDGEPQGPAGNVRAYDARTGKLAWTFDTVAQSGSFGGDTWAGNSARHRGGVNAWAPLSVDIEKGIVFLPLTSPSIDFYGGDRKGDGLFGNSLVALEASTGKRLWHFQTVHHDLWDYDLPAQPTLVQVRKEGKLVDAVAQITKTGFTFLFERTTGRPVYPIEERPVPQSEVPGEAASPTQPGPVKPPPFLRQTISRSELTTVTPESRADCEKLSAGALFGSTFTPIGLTPTIVFPGTNGGANWGGSSFDPDTRTLYVNSMDVGMIYRMTKRGEGSTVPYRQQGLGSPNSRFWDRDLNPCQQPPWGSLTAIDLDTGTFRWRSTLGVVDKLLEHGLPPTGAPNIGGSLVTAGGLVFIGATNDSRFRAFDKDSGKELWTTRLPASAHANPMTFLGSKTGKQYVVVAAGGGNKYNATYSDALVAFALPKEGEPENGPLVSHSRTARREAVREQAGNTMPARDEVFNHARHSLFRIACTLCHAGAQKQERAGFPAVRVCLSCHKTVGTDRPAIQALLARQTEESLAPQQLIYKLPDFVLFRHAAHTDTACSSCHGDMGKQERVQRVLAMKMKACVDCHTAERATVTCTACHELSQ
jgi:quinoprotein glucose dehydrogenase